MVGIEGSLEVWRAVENWRQSIQGQICAPFLSHRIFAGRKLTITSEGEPITTPIFIWFLLAHRVVIIPPNAEGSDYVQCLL